MADPLLILGASTRAAAGSAIRAGLNPSAVDLFCDDDLRQTTRVTRRAQDYPADLPRLAQDCPPSAWMFTGALENHSDIIEAISRERMLWGTPPDAIQRVRDPWHLARSLHAGGLLYPEIVCASQRDMIPRRRRNRWIRKPLRSAGGGKMEYWHPSRVNSPTAKASGSPPDDDASYYLQRVIDGQSQSAVFVAAGGAAVLIGITRQLVGAQWTGATGFRYAGSIGPLQPPACHVSTWCRTGDWLAREFGLLGLFGVDAIVNSHGIWTVEVNPRYTSSIEVLEFGLEVDSVAEHAAACRHGRLDRRTFASQGRSRGKAVIYASRELRIDESFVEAARRSNERQPWPEIADIPTAGQSIAAGHPVATLFASSETLPDVEQRLRDVVKTWRERWRP